MNRILIPLVIVSKVRKTVTAKDFPEPLPPVIMKYLASESNKGLYLLLSISVYKCYDWHIDNLIP